MPRRRLKSRWCRKLQFFDNCIFPTKETVVLKISTLSLSRFKIGASAQNFPFLDQIFWQKNCTTHFALPKIWSAEQGPLSRPHWLLNNVIKLTLINLLWVNFVAFLWNCKPAICYQFIVLLAVQFIVQKTTTKRSKWGFGLSTVDSGRRH